jgi:hypothetical protein
VGEKYRPEGFDETEDPLPRDMPDQQAAGQGRRAPEEIGPAPGDAPEHDTDDTEADVPDVDEAGAGPRGATPSQDDAPSDRPVPDEATD